METLEQLGRRLDVFNDLGSIVGTMKALAAASIRQYEQAVDSLNVYYRTVELGLHVVLREMPPPPRPASSGAAGVAGVVLGSDHGLCGRFNEDLADYSSERLREARGDGEPLRLMAVGARISALVESRGFVLQDTLPAPASAGRITDTVRKLLLAIDAWQAETPTPVYLLHNGPVSGSRYHPIGVQLLPVNFQRFRRLEEQPWPSRNLPTHTMGRGELFSSLLRQYFFVSIFRALAESLAAENASRLSAMHAVEKNIESRHEELLGEFRRRRQDEITTEILDIVSGYEALLTRGEQGSRYRV